MIDDTWVWRQLAPVTPPDATQLADMIWDGSRGLLFGGDKGGGMYSDETWELIGDEWNQLAPATSPSARALHHMAWDGSRIVLVGGYDGAVTVKDTWEYSAGTWTELFPANTLPDYNPVGSPGVAATALASQLIWNGSEFVILIPVYSPANLNDTWKYDGDWTDMSASPEYPPGVGSPGDSFDIWNIAMCWAGDRAVGGGGNNGVAHNGAVPLSNTCEFTAGGWLETVTGGTAWGSRYRMNFVWTGDEVVLFGGVNDPLGSDVEYNDVWTYDTATSTWTAIFPQGTPPTGRSSFMSVWDGGRLIIFGGNNGSAVLDETWVLEPAEVPVVAHLNHVFGLGR